MIEQRRIAIPKLKGLILISILQHFQVKVSCNCLPVVVNLLYAVQEVFIIILFLSLNATVEARQSSCYKKPLTTSILYQFYLS